MLPGYRFYPTEEELVSFYLTKQLEGGTSVGELNLSLVIPLLDVSEFEPWELPKLSGELCKGDTEQWFFFVPRHERENRGGRPSRTTSTGYWKATGSPGYVHSSNNQVIGVKKTMVFYKGKAPMGRKTKWKMNEYRALQAQETASSSFPTFAKLRHEVSLCRVYVVSGTCRAFDRRPLGDSPTEIASNQNVEEYPMAVTSPRGSQSVDNVNSLETSVSPGQLDHCEDQSGQQEEPALWEWEQLLNWP